MAKARLSLRNLDRTVTRLAKKVKGLRGKAANQAEKRNMTALHKKLTAMKSMMSGECPEHLFRSFELAAPTRARRAKAKRARKATKRARRGR